ncbi:MAG: GMC family oxidoreductase N-terminal domain-containing protein [Bacteriovoracia bacterium]
MSMPYDFAIVGSGVSGGRIAYELTRAGARCVLLEAGRAFDRKTFPRNEMLYSSQLFWGGGIEVSADGRLGFLRAKCVGGTSIVNQALLDRFDELAFDDWKARSGLDIFSAAHFAPFYDEIAKTVRTSAIPEPFYNANAKIFTQAFERTGYQWKPLTRAQGNCALEHGSDCIVCLGGCPRDSKQSSLVTVIRAAEMLGMKVESEWEADSVAETTDGVIITGTQRGKKVSLRAPHVVLAAGAFGNTRILHRSGFKPKLPALGENFSCHPQYMTYAEFDEVIDAHKGALQSVKSDDVKLRRAGYKFENVFAPPIATAMLFPGYGKSHQNLMKRYRHYASMEVCVRDEPTGSIQVERSGKLKLRKFLTEADVRKRDAGLSTLREFFVAAGAKNILQSDQGFGLHLMGGCVMGADAAHAVVDGDFRVHGTHRIYAADSSVFPSAPGINPSFTIMALGVMASRKIVEGAR